ncbi:MAG TPA: transposase [Anaerolineales bacterium]|nr:transposase [Anaerolineales bacterium]
MRKVPLIPGHYYHIYNRGVDRGNIFFKRKNWAFFLERFRQYCTPERASIIAYCLMPNHYHLLIHILLDSFGEKVMQPFTVSFTKAINNQQSRVGPLFQGPFQASLIDNDAYLIHFTRYIHLNPVAAGFVGHPEEREFSSYQDYLGIRNGTLPHSDAILGMFPDRAEYRVFVEAQTRDFSPISHLLFD